MMFRAATEASNLVSVTLPAASLDDRVSVRRGIGDQLVEGLDSRREQRAGADRRGEVDESGRVDGVDGQREKQEPLDSPRRTDAFDKVEGPAIEINRTNSLRLGSHGEQWAISVLVFW